MIQGLTPDMVENEHGVYIFTGAYILDKLGVGIASPASRLHVATDGPSSIINQSCSNTGGEAPLFISRKSGGTIASPSQTPVSHVMGGFQGRGFLGGGTWSTSGPLMQFVSTQPWSSTGTGARIEFYANEDNVTSPAIQVYIQNGVLIGVPTGLFKGQGTINAAGDIYKNNSAYTNPDWLLELWATGRIERYAANVPETSEARIFPLAYVESYSRENLRLPGIPDSPMGVFQRADALLEWVERLVVYAIEQEKRIARLEASLSRMGGAG